MSHIYKSDFLIDKAAKGGASHKFEFFKKFNIFATILEHEL